MKALKVSYWITTVIFTAMMSYSAFLYLTSADLAAAFTHLGFPQYFRVELAIAKLAGAVVLLLPFWPARLKEWAYAGFSINLVSAVVAHVSLGDPVNLVAPPVVFAAILGVSYYGFRRLEGSEDVTNANRRAIEAAA